MIVYLSIMWCWSPWGGRFGGWVGQLSLVTSSLTRSNVALRVDELSSTVGSCVGFFGFEPPRGVAASCRKLTAV